MPSDDNTSHGHLVKVRKNTVQIKICYNDGYKSSFPDNVK
jgi:hypothetical protein